MNKLAREINDVNKSKGFWDNMKYSIELTKDQVRFIGLYKHIKDAFIAQKLVLIHTEISEAVEATRLDGYEKDGYGLFEKDSFADELADSIIIILDLCGELDIDIQKQIDWKLEKNKQREFMHGKNS